MESVIVADGEGRHWKTEKGPRTSSDPLPNPFSLPEMTERVKNNGSGGRYDPLTRKRAENANESEGSWGREGASNSNPKELNADSKDTRGEEPC